ncbi:MAG: type-F conjugative transfer system protein TraW [Alphaproteobacteria bacterium]|nr:type-F conjugative transfer system protein TraW [Bacteroidota bacterium]MBA3814538.1 type-F conjugative transfer system protein TraW [Alphaproteobacteria bacterium]
MSLLIRRVVATAASHRFLGSTLKHICFFFAFLITDYCLRQSWILNTAQAKDLGVHGAIAPIEEIDPIEIIQQKLKVMEDSGELKKRNVELQEKARASVERPKPVEGITRTTSSRTFTYDPSYIVKQDLSDHEDRVFAKKGTKVNPLENISLSQNLVFFDGDDEEQLNWVKDQLAKNTEIKPTRLILVRGTPLKLSEELEIPVYFDQGGTLIQKLGISHVPAFVSQVNLHLKIEEIVLPSSRELSVEGER